MRAVFIAGTDTGVGKTVVTGLLGRYLSDRETRVVTQKWVETGARKMGQQCGGDIAVHLKLMGKSAKDFSGSLSLMNPYSFKFAVSPHLASRLEKKKVDAEKIKRSARLLSQRFDLCLIEGTGGLLVPFDERRLLIDIVKDLKIPVLLVARNSLGAINHTLLSIEALKNRGIKIAGIIFNDISRSENKVVLKDNKEIIEKLSGETVIGELPSFGKLRACPEHTEGPRGKNFDLLHEKFKPLGARILTVIARRI